MTSAIASIVQESMNPDLVRVTVLRREAMRQAVELSKSSSMYENVIATADEIYAWLTKPDGGDSDPA